MRCDTKGGGRGSHGRASVSQPPRIDSVNSQLEYSTLKASFSIVASRWKSKGTTPDNCSYASLPEQAVRTYRTAEIAGGALRRLNAGNTVSKERTIHAFRAGPAFLELEAGEYERWKISTGSI